MKEEVQNQIYTQVLKRLILHLQKRTDVQNIDLMNLSGFCRNCLSKWYVSEAETKGIKVDYEDARKIIYGMPYSDWKIKYQKEATKEQLNQWNRK
jgi:hypothetical protein|tara:strand:+ start:404 stop:688 length:285 start_codon:yes stop_codon:yes gene_type:complete